MFTFYSHSFSFEFNYSRDKGFIPLGFDSNILNFDQLPFLCPLSQEGVIYLFRKPNAMPIESKPESG